MPRKSLPQDRRRKTAITILPVMLVFIGVTACAPTYRVAAVPDGGAQSPPPPTTVYFYPNKGQSPEQQDRDRYECYLWAKKQTGFDPSAPGLPPHNRLEVVAEPPPGAGTAVGAVTGALLGAAVASRHHEPEGALVGALAGGILGSAVEASNRQQAASMQQYYDRQAEQRAAVTERQADDYRRAFTACLEGRDYTVR
ncbi:MAG: glycine zipper 2TM domain-containing protein [Deltaproteobacteria bacterium]